MTDHFSMTTTGARERSARMLEGRRKELRGHLITNLGEVCTELGRRGRPLNAEELVYFRRLTLRTVEHVLELL